MLEFRIHFHLAISPIILKREHSQAPLNPRSLRFLLTHELPRPARNPSPEASPSPRARGAALPGAAFHLLPPANANSFGAATSFSLGVTCANACKTPGPCCPGQRHTVLLAWPCLRCLKLQAPRLVFFFANNGLTSPFF